MTQFLVVITCLGEEHHTYALVHSGAAGNCMAFALARTLKLPQQALSNPITVLSVSGEPLPGGQVSYHTEPIKFQVGGFSCGVP